MEKEKLVQYNFKICIEDKEKIQHIAEVESKRTGFKIHPAEMTRKILKDFIRDWTENEVE